MKLAIRKHWREVAAVLGLIVLAAFVAVYILNAAGLALPARRGVARSTSRSSCRTPRRSSRARARPCAWRASRWAASPASRSSSGVAVVDVELEPEYEDLIREDATALLRPKTVAQGHVPRGVARAPARCSTEGGRISVANTLPDVDPDEIYAALDSDTRPYLKLLVSGAGKGLQRPRQATCARCSAASSRCTATWRASRAPRPAGAWRSSG